MDWIQRMLVVLLCFAFSSLCKILICSAMYVSMNCVLDDILFILSFFNEIIVYSADIMYLIVINSGFVRVGRRRGGWWVPTVFPST